MPNKKSLVTEQQVLAALSAVQEPELRNNLVALNMIRDVQIEDATVRFTVMLTTRACPFTGRIEEESRQAVMKIPGVKQAIVKMDANTAADTRIRGQLNIPVRNTVAVASGKGGVGKSTVTVNLALALAKQGANVGLMDADVYGPNIPMMMGVMDRPRSVNGKIQPIRSYGIKLMSMGFLVEPDQPLVWRGPMLHGVIRQFLSDVDWGDLDYLLIDLPPGTGDVQLSLAQAVPLTGAIMVTTPQDVALADVRKGVGAFEKLEVPILGLIENMSYFICPHCGERTEIFSYGGGRRAAEQWEIPFLGEIPLNPDVRLGGDTGKPIVALKPDSLEAKAFHELAQVIAAKISVLNMTRKTPGIIADIPILKH
ncbi:MAG: Mrp/NBP35 family ATP-binding protein [Chloroflexi bacterium]|nr:Mrp/NBP35 family ATP-binding protein [Chloroflexota bacterium]